MGEIIISLPRSQSLRHYDIGVDPSTKCTSGKAICCHVLDSQHLVPVHTHVKYLPQNGQVSNITIMSLYYRVHINLLFLYTLSIGTFWNTGCLFSGYKGGKNGSCTFYPSAKNQY